MQSRTYRIWNKILEWSFKVNFSLTVKIRLKLAKLFNLKNKISNILFLIRNVLQNTNNLGQLAIDTNGGIIILFSLWINVFIYLQESKATI